MKTNAGEAVRLRFAIIGSLCAAAAVAWVPSVASAQTMPAAADAGALEEITVTATRRETNLQSTPIAVSAISSQQITALAPHDLGDLASSIPNFSAARIAGFNAASFAMRGVGQNNIIVYFDSPVAVLVDDFVMPSPQTQLLDTFDIEQVEVLRGPQGTLFGKNTTGGVVAVRTKRPEFGETTATVQTGVGSFGTWEAKAAVNIPIGDRVAVRAVGAYRKSDGYMTNGYQYGPVSAFVPNFPFNGAAGRGSGIDLGGEDAANGRLKLNWRVTDSLTALLQYEIIRDHSKPAPMVNSSPDPTFIWPLLGFPAPTGDPYDSAGINTANTFMNMNRATVDVDGAYLALDWTVGAGTVTSVSGFRKQKSRLPFTASTTPNIQVAASNLNVFDARRDDDRETLQQEVRFASNFSGPLNFVVGGFFQRDNIDFCVVTVEGFLDMLGLSTPYGPFNSVPAVTCSTQDAESYAGFAEGTWAFTDRLKLTAGFRITKDKKTWRGRQDRFFQELLGYGSTVGDNSLRAGDFTRYPDGVITIDRDWTEPSWRVSLGYQVTDDAYLYAGASRGYKAGGFNDQIGLSRPYGDDLNAFAAAADATDPEFANSYEIGVRTEGFDHRLRANVTAFLVDYKDLQRQINVPLTIVDSGGNQTNAQVTRYFNAAKARVKGIEAEVVALPADNVTLRGTLGYQKGEYKSYNTPLPAAYDLASAPLDRTPKWTWALDATYTLPLANSSALSFNANVSFVDKNLYTQSITAESSNTYLNARTLLNASVTFTGPAEHYFVRVFGRNLTDKKYLNADLVVATLFAWSQYGPPRYYGAEAGFNFGGR